MGGQGDAIIEGNTQNVITDEGQHFVTGTGQEARNDSGELLDGTNGHAAKGELHAKLD